MVPQRSDAEAPLFQRVPNNVFIDIKHCYYNQRSFTNIWILSLKLIIKPKRGNRYNDLFCFQREERFWHAMADSYYSPASRIHPRILDLALFFVTSARGCHVCGGAWQCSLLDRLVTCFIHVPSKWEPQSFHVLRALIFLFCLSWIFPSYENGSFHLNTGFCSTHTSRQVEWWVRHRVPRWGEFAVCFLLSG